MGALAYPEYRWFFGSTTFASLAYWLQLFAVGWLIIEIAVRDGVPNGGPLYLGLVGLARSVPTIVFGLAGGVLADRFDRRRTLFVTRLAFAALGAILAVLTLTGLVGLPAVMVVSALSAVIFAVDTPARLAASPMLTAPEDQFSAIGMTRAVMQASSLIGPLIGGVLIIPLGVGWLLMVNALMYVFAGFGLNRLPPLPPDPEMLTTSAWRSVAAGFAYIRERPTLRGFLIVNVVFAFFGCSFPFLLPAVAHDTLHAGAVELSWLVSAAGLGGLAASVALTSMVSWRRPGRVLLAHAFALAIAHVVFGLQRELVAAIVACAFLGYLSIAYYGGTGNLLQVSVPHGLRGRVVSIQATIYSGGTQLGTLILGALGAFIGISNAMIVAGVIVLATSLVMSQVVAIRDASPTHASLQA